MKIAIFSGILLLGVQLLTSSAFADGFRCSGQTTGLKFALYNHTQGAKGTRTPAILVISDPLAANSLRTIATFSSDGFTEDQQGTLEYQGYGSFEATVAPSVADSVRGERIIAGMRLADLTTLRLSINFSYASGNTQLARLTEEIPAHLFYQTKAGEVIEENAICARYLKTQ